ncbi:GNAT family N-acetyltransferase [Streptomyces sp. NPDC007088]|uniref:GNAT family N-acetyltransferase n=1 Tax=Streptomyces sp. NPDC007088 TaxID=3364773 RepID=UPI003687DDCA
MNPYPAGEPAPMALPSLPSGHLVSTDPARLDLGLVHHWLSTDAYWALGRSPEKQRRAVEGSLNFGAYDSSSGAQVAYARVVTDRTTFAWLCDVYVDPDVRGEGLGTAFVKAVRDHVSQFGVRRFVLATNDAHEVYRRLGFTELPDAGKWMVLTTG